MGKRKGFTQKQRVEILEKTNGHCAYCGEEITTKQMQVDHIIAVERAHHLREAQVDVNDIQNLFPACRPCNYIKGDRNVEEFRIYIEGLPATLLRDSVTFRNALRFGIIKDEGKQCVFYYETIGLTTPKNNMDDIYKEQHRQIWERIQNETIREEKRQPE